MRGKAQPDGRPGGVDRIHWTVVQISPSAEK